MTNRKQIYIQKLGKYADNPKVDMTSGQKIAASLLSALALFGAFVVSFHSFLFKEIEMKFYTEAKIEENVQQLNNISDSYDSYITNVLAKIETAQDAYVKDPAVRSFYEQNPSEKDVSQRRSLTEQLFNSIPTLDGIRLIDKNGRNVHFSTYDDTDILRQTGISKIYKNYPDIIQDDDEIPFEVLSKNLKQNSSVILFDEGNSRIILAVPFYWVDGIYSGSFYFYFNLRDVEKEFIKSDVLNIGQNLQIISDDDLTGGFVIGVPSSLVKEFQQPINNYFDSKVNGILGSQTPEKLLEKEDGIFYVALSSTLENGKKIVGVYTSDLFELSTEIKVLIYICVFISGFLILFLIFSFHRDPIDTLKHKVKRIQYGVIKEYIDNKEKLEWSSVVSQLQNRKKDLSKDILKSLNVHSKKKRKELDDFLDQNWEEIFTVIGNKSENQSGAQGAGGTVNVSADSQLLKEIRNVLSEVLREVQSEVRNVRAPSSVGAPSGAGAAASVRSPSGAGAAATAGAVAATAGAVAATAGGSPTAGDDIEELDDVEEIEEVEELDDVEEIEEVEELDDVEEIEDAEEVEEIEEAEEVLDDVEEIEEAEEVLDDVEEIEEAEEVLDEVEEIEEAEEVTDDVEDIEDVEEIPEAEEVDDIEEIPEADELDEVEELDEAEDLDDVEELDEADPDAELGHIDTPIMGKWDDDFFKNFCGAFNYEYKPSNDTFFATERFPTVDDLFAEELVLGSTIVESSAVSEPLDITVYKLPLFDQEDVVEQEEEISAVEEEAVSEDDSIEELAVAAEGDYENLNNPSHYSMTSLGDSIILNPPTLESAENDDSIVEKDGVYCISDDLDYTDVIQDKEFKTLVDSIIEN